MISNPLVSINCITFNHEKYIALALEGFLMQKTNFPFEIIIHDDASTDNTVNIIKSYADKYPDLFVTIFQDINQYSQGVKPCFENVMPKCRGKYVAHCEGDDYWTDPYKLQKQIDFLEANPEYVFTFHDSEILDQNTGVKRLRIGNRKIDEIVDLESVINQNNISTASIVHRNILQRDTMPEWLFKVSKGDYGLVVLLAEKGLGRLLSGVMSGYRVHDGGVWSGTNPAYRNMEDIKFFNCLNEYFPQSKVKVVIKKRLSYCFMDKAFIKIRNGEFISGLFIYLKHINAVSDKKMRKELKKILSAIKSGILSLVRKMYSFFQFKHKSPVV